MSRRDWRLFVADMQEACIKISGYVSGMGLEDFRADPRTVDAVVRNLEINPRPLSAHRFQTLPPQARRARAASRSAA
ncbi:DUF86 domain-containing protein [Synechococcus sp. 1G10]|uniref:HepT-like ribonuclease domain-containing protein n=1 Tax=Synechococcus sp. 1G10 TaxID=2025605 RepID=UPI00117DF486|nr:hypothetical protein [Synechococcus sp. 1G10]